MYQFSMKCLKVFCTTVCVAMACGYFTWEASAINNAQPLRSSNSGFIAKQDNKIIKAIGKYDERRPPYSTFKVALALMGFDAKILESKDAPKWEFDEKYEKNFQSWYSRKLGEKFQWCQAHTPQTFMKNSVVWYSHLITQQLGVEKFQQYVTKLNYGNQDVSGTPGQDDGLLNSWLGTSLKISPREQIELIENLLAGNLNVSKDAQQKTREILYREEWNGWKLYGKTGGGSGGTGWFVGWIEKDGAYCGRCEHLRRRS